jgi:hypothetical protein
MAKSTAAQRSRWQREIKAWSASGKTLSAWARERGLSRDALEYWKRRLVPHKPAALALIAVPPAPASVAPASPSAPIELVIGAARVILAAGFDPQNLYRVLEVLERRC